MPTLCSQGKDHCVRHSPSQNLLGLLNTAEEKLISLISDPQHNSARPGREVLEEVLGTILTARQQVEYEGNPKCLSCDGKNFENQPQRTACKYCDLNGTLDIERGKLNAIIEHLPVGVTIVDIQGNVLLMNRASLELHGFRSDAEMFTRFEAYEAEFEMRFLDGRVIPVEAWPGSRAMRGEYIQDFELRLRNKTKEFERIVSYSVTPIYSSEGEIIVVVFLIQDLTERIQSEQALRESEARFRSVLENSLDVAYRRNLMTDRYDYMSPVVEQVLGFGAEEMMEMGIDEVVTRIYPDDRERLQRALEQAAETGAGRLEYRFRVKDGQYRWLADHVTVMKDHAGQPSYRSGILRDITHVKRIEEELRTLNQQLEQRVAERTAELVELQRRLMDMVEDERTELSRDLHDGPMQDLYALSYRLAGFNSRVPAEEIDNELTSVRKELIDITQTLRSISQDLLPSTLPKFGLKKSIQSHANTISRASTGLSIHLNLQIADGSLTNQEELVFFRIYKTLITNVIRHAQASDAQVRIYQDAEDCYLEIEDNGIGFDLPTSWIELAREGHMGLVSARERAQSVGGDLEVQSQPGKGTLLRVVVPLNHTH